MEMISKKKMMKQTTVMMKITMMMTTTTTTEMMFLKVVFQMQAPTTNKMKKCMTSVTNTNICKLD